MEQIARVVVCDDDKLVHNQLNNLIIEYSRIYNEVNPCLHAFQDVESLMAFDKVIDLLFLDIELGEISGVDIVPIIRKKHPEVTIIFISSHTKYFIYSHRLHVFQFLTKPFDQQIFFEEMNRFYDKFHLSQDLYTVTCKGRSVQFPIQEIVYIEADLRRLKIHHVKMGVYEMAGRIGQEEKNLQPYGFLRIHHSFLVNPRYIDRLKSQEVTLCIPGLAESNQILTLPVSKGKTQQVRNQYHQWLLAKRV